MLHLIRKGISEGCPVCGVDAFKACKLKPGDAIPVQLALDLEDKHVEVQFLEYQVIQAIQRLRALQPDHTLVTVVAAVLKYQATEQSRR